MSFFLVGVAVAAELLNRVEKVYYIRGQGKAVGWPGLAWPGLATSDNLVRVANWPPTGPKTSILAILKGLGHKKKVIGPVGQNLAILNLVWP